MSAARVVAAWAEKCSGPGWHNTVVWVLLRDEHGCLSVECIQSDAAGVELRALADVSDAISVEMRNHAANHLKLEAER